MTQQSNLADQILDTALVQAEISSWDAVTLHDIAESLGISLNDIRLMYPQKDDLVEAWFDRADKTVLSEKISNDFSTLPDSDRLHKIIMQWLFSLAKHRRVTRQMLCYKFEFGHIHLQILGIMRISRTVQWFREAALLNTKGIHRIIEEICITSIYLASFARWLFDDSENSRNTDQFLKNALKHVKTLNQAH